MNDERTTADAGRDMRQRAPFGVLPNNIDNDRFIYHYRMNILAEQKDSKMSNKKSQQLLWQCETLCEVASFSSFEIFQNECFVTAK